MNTTGNFHAELTIPYDVIRLDQDHFPHPWTEAQWKELSPAQNHLFTWKQENKLIGYALFQYLTGDDTAHLLKILVLPESRGRGEVQKFWKEVLIYLKEQGLKNIYLEVEAGNTRAISFYEKCGLQHLRRNKGYYSNGEDALIMSMTL
jgi:ribosomal-protein-alanine N-acetyltransferase